MVLGKPRSNFNYKIVIKYYGLKILADRLKPIGIQVDEFGRIESDGFLVNLDEDVLDNNGNCIC